MWVLQIECLSAWHQVLLPAESNYWPKLLYHLMIFMKKKFCNFKHPMCYFSVAKHLTESTWGIKGLIEPRHRRLHHGAGTVIKGTNCGSEGNSRHTVSAHSQGERWTLGSASPARHAPRSGWILPPQLNLSRNITTGTPRSLFLRCF